MPAPSGESAFGPEMLGDFYRNCELKDTCDVFWSKADVEKRCRLRCPLPHKLRSRAVGLRVPSTSLGLGPPELCPFLFQSAKQSLGFQD